MYVNTLGASKREKGSIDSPNQIPTLCEQEEGQRGNSNCKQPLLREGYEETQCSM